MGKQNHAIKFKCGVLFNSFCDVIIFMQKKNLHEQPFYIILLNFEALYI